MFAIYWMCLTASLGLISIIEMNIYDNSLSRRLTATWSTNNSIKWFLVLDKVVGRYYDILLVDSGYESYPT